MVFGACATPIAHGVGSYKTCECSAFQTLQHIHGVHAHLFRCVAAFKRQHRGQPQLRGGESVRKACLEASGQTEGRASRSALAGSCATQSSQARAKKAR